MSRDIHICKQPSREINDLYKSHVITITGKPNIVNCLQLTRVYNQCRIQCRSVLPLTPGQRNLGQVFRHLRQIRRQDLRVLDEDASVTSHQIISRC